MSLLKKTLEELGLSDKEARVYLASLELGPSSVQKISQIAEINRVTTYVILESLVEKGLSSTTQKGKKTLFIAEDPEQLSSLLNKMQEEIKEKEKALEQIMPELNSLLQISGKKPVVRVYEGREGLNSLLQDYLKSTKVGSEWLGFVPVDQLYKVFPPQKEEIPGERMKKKIKCRVIYNTANNNIMKTDPKLLREARSVPAKKFPFTSGVDIYGENKLAIINYKDKPIGIMIESKELHDTFKIIFEIAWEAAGKYKG